MSYKLRLLGSTILLLLIPAAASAVTWVKTAKNPEEGWMLQVDGESIAVHGVVWSFTPIGENYSYDLWSQPEELIKEMIDTDAVLMRDMGVNAIRVFTDVPPKWLSYLYQRYGIYTVVNDLFGRYGLTVDGRWHPRTNYADPRSREVILESLKENVSRYVDVPGVLFYLLGNENNYGLEWESDAIEDLPIGQRLEVRAGYLYSLFEEGIKLVNEIDPTKPVGIVNGDIQYLNIIEALVPSIDILGVNTYRGEAAHNLFFEGVADTLDVPIVFTEFGSDAFNAVTREEDQYNQARFLRSQWEEIYRQSYGKGLSQNVLGGFVFQWMDEWWKTGQTENLDIHDEAGSWSNGAYSFDAGVGADNVNNMNEEWFGIVAQSTVKTNGINERRPRAAYYLLKDLWTLDQLSSTNKDIDAHFNRDIMPYANRGEIAALKQKNEEDPVVSFRGKAVFVGNGQFSNQTNFENGSLNNIKGSHGEWLYLGTDVSPSEDLDGGMTVRLQGGVPNTTFEAEEWTRYAPLTINSTAGSTRVLTDPANPSNNPALPNQPFQAKSLLEIYDGYLNWRTKYFDFDFYYHNGHTDWLAEGDYFGMLPESFDFFGMDKDNSKAPYGAEIAGKEFLEGLKIYGGPEIYWGAAPQVMFKYYRPGDVVSWSLLYNEVLAAGKKPNAVKDYHRRASAWTRLNFLPWIQADLGVLFSGMEHLDKTYDHVGKNLDGSLTLEEKKKIDILDTLAAKITLRTDIFLYTTIFAKYIYAGRVADSTATIISRDGSQIEDVGTGNRHEFEGGFRFQYGGLSVMPKFLARLPITHPLGLKGPDPRYSSLSPVAVIRNREAYKAEIVLTWDPAGDTYFYDWNNSDRENASFAGYVSFLYSFYEGPTDASSSKNRYGADQDFGKGLPSVTGLWSVKSRLLWNAAPSLRLIGGFQAGAGQSTGENQRLVTYYGGALSVRLGQWLLDSSVDFNAWGYEDWYRQFNITYPLQWKLDVSVGFDTPTFLETENRIGLRWKGRTYDKYSRGSGDTDRYDWNMELLMYLTLSW